MLQLPSILLPINPFTINPIVINPFTINAISINPIAINAISINGAKPTAARRHAAGRIAHAGRAALALASSLLGTSARRLTTASPRLTLKAVQPTMRVQLLSARPLRFWRELGDGMSGKTVFPRFEICGLARRCRRWNARSIKLSGAGGQLGGCGTALLSRSPVPLQEVSGTSLNPY